MPTEGWEVSTLPDAVNRFYGSIPLYMIFESTFAEEVLYDGLLMSLGKLAVDDLPNEIIIHQVVAELVQLGSGEVHQLKDVGIGQGS